MRIFQAGGWTVPGQTPDTVAAALAKLRPSSLSSLIRYEAGERVRDEEVAAWNKIRDAVHAEVPDAQFGIEINALEYKTAAEIEQRLEGIRKNLDNDGWLLDFYTPAAKVHPEVMEAAVQDAHEHGEWIGGNAFGIAGTPPIPPGTDFLAVQDFRLKLDVADVRRLADRITTYFHLGNSPALKGSSGCQFMRDLTTAQRERYVTLRASEQTKGDFRMSYPVLFPECLLPRKGKEVLVSYDALTDGDMISVIERLMDKYE